MRHLAILAVLVIFAAGCGSGSGGADPSASPTGPGNGAAQDVDGAWRLRSGRGPQGAIPKSAVRKVTLTIDGNEIGGIAACNHYGGTAMIDGTNFFVGQGLSMTDMGCMDRDISRAESIYIDALPRAVTIERNGRTLTISGPGVELRFQRMRAADSD